MKIMMQLLSDTIFGNGISVPGGEDISLLHDTQGFPYFKGSTFKGIFREELQNLLRWKGLTVEQAREKADQLLGRPGDDAFDEQARLVFADFTIPAAVRTAVLEEIKDNPDGVLAAFTNLRTFTAMDDGGMVKEGSLRMARCANQGTWYESRILCSPEYEPLVCEVLSIIKWIGTMRNRGFGNVRIVKEV